MNDNTTKLKLATNVPDPPDLTEDALREIGEASREWRTAFLSETSDMEVMTPEDLKIRAR